MEARIAVGALTGGMTMPCRMLPTVAALGAPQVAPEMNTARVRLTRDRKHEPVVVSGVHGLTVLKTTQSGFSDYLQDKYTLLPATQERCMATEMSAEWRCARSGAGRRGAQCRRI